MGFGVWGLGFGVWGLGFGVWGLGLRAKLKVEGDRLQGVQDLRLWGTGLKSKPGSPSRVQQLQDWCKGAAQRL